MPAQLFTVLKDQDIPIGIRGQRLAVVSSADYCSLLLFGLMFLKFWSRLFARMNRVNPADKKMNNMIS